MIPTDKQKKLLQKMAKPRTARQLSEDTALPIQAISALLGGLRTSGLVSEDKGNWKRTPAGGDALKKK